MLILENQVGGLIPGFHPPILVTLYEHLHKLCKVLYDRDALLVFSNRDSLSYLWAFKSLDSCEICKDANISPRLKQPLPREYKVLDWELHKLVC